ncbi:hypothetical protein CRM22_011001 [Opisthorchis felineus]|uniref:Uncharacterized protein n=1 Tax=Opisthorchis felineus TaxID=147828 RepID=A0A4S2KG88_OPIFE|nr:hypothetical protein CRM22_011001 [Opisthorchis felineus]
MCCRGFFDCYLGVNFQKECSPSREHLSSHTYTLSFIHFVYCFFDWTNWTWQLHYPSLTNLLPVASNYRFFGILIGSRSLAPLLYSASRKSGIHPLFVLCAPSKLHIW